ncbi:hypothetical protein [Synechococcus sp. CCY 9618]|uniref:hypothetical protein n=1 Tax=Synechococcus sp. CCY 9618 TaxID=2815602 RepID=UPI001C22F78B|nr:hypothetical protein [Synechococcus sp. CCY 9618]
MRRALILSLQPPGSGGVQARRYGKLLPHLGAADWEFHVVGPDPMLDALIPEPSPEHGRYCHYSRQVSLSRVCAIRKNRHRRGSPPHLWYSLRQLVHRWLERRLHHDGEARVLEGIEAKALATEATIPFDVVAGICPDFRVLETARRLAGRLDKPWIAIYDDPFGHREKGAFHPADPERQRALLESAAGVVFASPLTLRRYREQGLLGSTPATFLPDCFDPAFSPPAARAEGGTLTLFHPGNLGPWRPLGPLLDAVQRWQREGRGPLRIDLYGYVYPEARNRIEADPSLRRCVGIHPAVSNADSHALAERADALLVLIGPRHTDNLPSKFFEYLPHATPVLAAGPAGNPLEKLLATLQKGIYCDIEDSEAIFAAIEALQLDGGQHRLRHGDNREAIAAYAAPTVARAWGSAFDRFLARREGQEPVPPSRT